MQGDSVSEQEIDRVSPSDHDNGFVCVTVERKCGQKETVKLSAPPWRVGESLLAEVQRARNPFLVLLACLPEDQRDPWLNKLVPSEISRLTSLAWELTFGVNLQKKIQSLGESLLPYLTLTPPADLSPSACSAISPQPT
jgi:hypothetical protein